MDLGKLLRCPDRTVRLLRGTNEFIVQVNRNLTIFPTNITKERLTWPVYLFQEIFSTRLAFWYFLER
jgi:hypothetical protein